MPGEGKEACTIAIAHDATGRHYFVSVDGARFRQVPHFPLGPAQAELLFECQRGIDKDRLELMRDYGSRISFMSVLG